MKVNQMDEMNYTQRAEWRDFCNMAAHARKRTRKARLNQIKTSVIADKIMCDSDADRISNGVQPIHGRFA